MKIIILGAGQVGAALAENLVREGHDITMVDLDAQRLANLQDRLDIRTVQGYGSYPNILKQAGADSADMLIAVTSNDEINIVACQVAYTLFRTPTKIARIRSRYYQTYSELFDDAAMPIDAWISPEQLVTHYAQLLIEHPGSLQALEFANGSALLVAVKPYFGGPLVNKSLADLENFMVEFETHVAAIFRGNESIPLTDEAKIEIGDEVFFIAERTNINTVMSALGRLEEPNKRVMIAGGGNIGITLAQSLENHYNVKLIERDADRAQRISEELNNTTILLGDVSDRDLLVTENIEFMDVFCAITNNDETNIMACLQAKRLGVAHVMALVARTAYVELLEGGSEIDIVISPQQITIGSILKLIRCGDILNDYSLRRGAAEAIEVVAHGDQNTSSVIGRALNKIKLPEGATIGAIIRNDVILSPKPDRVLETDDHIILFLDKRKHLRRVEQLFQVNATFL